MRETRPNATLAPKTTNPPVTAISRVALNGQSEMDRGQTYLDV